MCVILMYADFEPLMLFKSLFHTMTYYSYTFLSPFVFITVSARSSFDSRQGTFTES